MLRFLRKAITLVVFVSLSAISIGAAGVVYWYRLPAPEAADGATLFRWLVTREISNETPDTQQRLLRRLEAELGKPPEGLDALSENLDAKREAQLRKNLEYLGRMWLQEKAAIYANLNKLQREEFLDARLMQLQNLGVVYQAMPKRPDADRNKSVMGDAAMAFAVMKMVSEWIETSEPEQQKQMQTLVTALQARVFSRTIRIGI